MAGFSNQHMRSHMLNPEFQSIYLKEIGIPDIDLLFKIINKNNINLGKLDLASLNTKQLNTLLDIQASLKNCYCRLFFDTENNLIITTEYRYDKEHQDTKYQVSWISMQIDFLFGRREDYIEE